MSDFDDNNSTDNNTNSTGFTRAGDDVDSRGTTVGDEIDDDDTGFSRRSDDVDDLPTEGFERQADKPIEGNGTGFTRRSDNVTKPITDGIVLDGDDPQPLEGNNRRRKGLFGRLLGLFGRGKDRDK